MSPTAHLLESTVCAAIAGLLVLALRRAPARLRHGVWLLALLKFLVPFSLLTIAGRTFGAWVPALAPPAWLDRSLGFLLTTVTTAEPSSIAAAVREPSALALLTIWTAGAAAIVIWRARQVRATAALLRDSTPLECGREVDALQRIVRRFPHAGSITVRLGRSNLEPAVVGAFSPAILWPAGLSDRLSDAELDAILAHEICHVARRDNAVGYVVIAVETLFWFYPLIWWLGARVIAERERACDEEVVYMGADMRSYAEGILKVCGFCLRSPAAFVAGVGGSKLAQRVERIMTESRSVPRSPSTPLFVAALAVVMAAPSFAIGVAAGRPGGSVAGPAQEQTTVYKPGNGVTQPVLVREVKPKYTREAMEAKIEGIVRMAVVILETGGVGDVRVTQSLDTQYGLDAEAVSSVRQWEFKPGTKDGKPVAVEVAVEMSFKLR